MKVSVFSLSKVPAITVAKQITNKLIAKSIEIDDNKPDIVIAIGGDGTLLNAFHKYGRQLDTTRFVAVRTGHLGFYSDWIESEIDQLVESISQDGGKVVEYPLVEAELTFEDGLTKNILALNEITVIKQRGTLIADVFIENAIFEHFRGDGLTFATPIGSTAFNKSVGGAIVHPRISAMQMTEIASINNRVFRTIGSSIILPTDQNVALNLENDQVIIDYDNLHEELQGIKSIVVNISNQKIKFAEYHHIPFWRRVQNSFIGDLGEV